ncbi:MAG: nuclear transport factor 2 family protein [Bdellovibrionaceae bacterium]|nr:nuclear transport factor 2 family protein [Pseudobdellovibrionaceae bacterium]
MIENEIRELEKRLNEADSSSVRDTRPILEELLDDEAVLIGPGGELHDKAFVVKNHGPERVPFVRVIVEELDVTAMGESALVLCRTRYVTTQGQFQIRFLRIWRKRQNQWRVVAGTITMVKS